MGTETDWFEEWFDSALYEQMYAHRDEEEAERLADLIKELIPPESCHHVLDLGCGRGRHSLKLAERGYTVTGIDLSPNAIEQARSKAEKLELNNVHFQTGDMRTPLTQNFDLIVNLFTTFGYFENDTENKAVLDSIHNMLNTDGYLIIDFLNAYYVKKNLKPQEAGSLDGLEYKIERSLENGSVQKSIQFYHEGQDNTKTYHEKVKLYDRTWFKKELNNRNFEVEKIMGNYNGEAFSKDESPRLIIIARKR